MATFTKEQYHFLVQQVARHRTPQRIVWEFGQKKEWRDTSCTEQDVLAIRRESLPEAWQAIYDEEHLRFMAAALDDQQLQIAIISEAVMDGKADFLKGMELIAKIQGGFFKGKAIAVSGDTSDGPTTFTFGLDRAGQS